MIGDIKLKLIFNLFDYREKKNFFLLTSFMFINSLLEIFSLGLIIPIIGLMFQQNIDLELLKYLLNFFNISELNIFTSIIYFFLIFQIIKILFSIYYLFYETKYIHSFKERIASRLMHNYFSQNYIFFIKNNSAKLLRNITYGVDMSVVFLFQFLKVLLDLIMLSFIFIFLSFYNFQITFFLISGVLLFFYIYSFNFKNKLSEYGYKKQKHLNKKIQYFQESIENIKIIKLFIKEKFFFNKFKFENSQISKLSISSEFFRSLPKPLIELFLIFCISLILLNYAYSENYIAPKIFETLAVYLAAALRVMPSTSRILSGYLALKNSYPEIENISKEIKKEIKISEKKYKKFEFKKYIDIRIKKFFYTNDKDFFLKNIIFKIAKGEKVGIVGKSGSGKSSIIDLILGLIKTDNGFVKVDGRPIHENIKSWHNLIGYVPQRITMIEDTIRNNILFGRNSNDYNEKKLLELIRNFRLSKFVNSLPNGLDSIISEKGLNISGGEMQRIAICRAMLHNPDILIMDEATSSLDSATEDQILDYINKLSDKTVIFISHKMNTLKYCDSIYKLDNYKFLKI